ncbi:MAG TPA: choice-of-anchor tandem repeat GloVer-containing protein, partial [Verrucomicrobiae bacterium]
MANVRSLLLVPLMCLASLPLAGAQLVPIASFPPGESPSASLFQDANSNFYGVTANGGVFGNGTIYMVTPAGAFSTLYSFDGTHGAAPEAPIVKGPTGEFFGTASQGGIGNGVIFEFSPFSLVATFNSSTNIAGSMPMAGLLLGAGGVLYGTTVAGGSNDDGTIYRLSLGRNGFSNLFSFSETNGASPYAGLIQGGNGLLYGTTRYGGDNGAGTVFEIDTNGNFTNLASFGGANGAGPNQIVQGRDGNFYGTTLEGGTSGAGTIFRMTSEGTIQSLFSFNGVSGSQPVGKLVPGLNGLLYGVTLSGGSNGLGTIFTINTNGAFTNVAAFADFGFPPAGLIQGVDGNLYGTATSGGANGSGVIYELSGFPPSILVQPVARLNQADGASVTFSVSATPQPVAYQWMRNGMPLTDSNEISGSTTSKVTIDPATWVDVGSYSVIITNGGGSVTSTVVVLGITQPTVAITSPHASARTTNMLITGTASGKPGKTPLTNVLWSIDNLATGTETLGSATLVSNGLTDTWSISSVLLPGTNIVVVQSVDRSNIVSSRASEEIFYIQAAPFVLSTNGPGSVKGAASIAGNVPPTNGAMLNIGEGYTLTAVAAKNYVLTNWTVATNGTVFLTTNSTTLHFVMKEGMEIAANFTTNLFIGAAETYNGLFYDATNGVSEQTAGMLNSLTLNSQGSYTAKLLFDGGTYNFSGSFDTSGNAVKMIATKGGSVTLTMALDWTSGQINGAVSGSGWSSPLYAEAA